jgi:hypothetical protein
LVSNPMPGDTPNKCKIRTLIPFFSKPVTKQNTET